MSGAITGNPIGINNNDLVCQHSEHGGSRTTWCDHILQSIELAEDAPLVHPERTYHVPIFPTLDKYAIIRLGEKLESAIKMCDMTMLYTPDIGQGKHIPLGYWVEGDGFMAFRNCVIDYMRSNLHPDEQFNEPTRILTSCPQVENGTHTMISQKKMIMIASSPDMKISCLWDIVFEKACTPCREASDPNGNFGLTGI